VRQKDDEMASLVWRTEQKQKIKEKLKTKKNDYRRNGAGKSP